MTRCRCFLPDLAGFTGSYCTAPLSLINGESGIRTHGGVSPTHAFQACSFNHSDISPNLFRAFRLYHKHLSIGPDDADRFRPAIRQNFCELTDQVVAVDRPVLTPVIRETADRFLNLTDRSGPIVPIKMMQSHRCVDHSLVKTAQRTFGFPPQILPGLVGFVVQAPVKKSYPFLEEVAFGHRFILLKQLRKMLGKPNRPSTLQECSMPFKGFFVPVKYTLAIRSSVRII